MTSWRDITSERAQADLDGLLSAVLPFAEQQLTAHGELWPFGAAVSADGETSLAAVGDDHGDSPQSEAILTGLYEVARARADDQRAVAFVADVLARGTYAVRVELEHQEGVALVVLLPYKRTIFKKTVTLKQMSVSGAQPKVWSAGSQLP